MSEWGLVLVALLALNKVEKALVKHGKTNDRMAVAELPYLGNSHNCSKNISETKDACRKASRDNKEG